MKVSIKHVRQTSRGFSKGRVPVGSTILEKAKEGYEAYAEMAKWKNFQGADMPPWDALPDTIKNNWGCAAKAIMKKCVEEIRNYAVPSHVCMRGSASQ